MSWEERFDDAFGIFIINSNGQALTNLNVKSFIESEIAEAEKRGARRALNVVLFEVTNNITAALSKLSEAEGESPKASDKEG